ncbi:MAG: signal transduction histidine kinase [Rickettsiales bacterium]
MGVIFVLGFAPLDMIVYPNIAKVLISARIITVIILFISLALLHKKVKFLGIVMSITVFIMIDVLVFLTEGASSPYYAGLTLTVVALSLLMSWTFMESLFSCCMMVFLYIITIVIHAKVNNFDHFTPVLANNLFFIVSIAFFGVASSYFNSKLRFKEFCLNYELEEKNEELAKMDQMKTQFFANISHEFRTPLTLILGPVQELLYDSNNKLSSAVNNSLNIIKQNGFRLLNLVNDLLDVMSLEEGKTNLRLEKININEFIGATADSMGQMADMKQIELSKNIDEQDVFIKADIGALEKITLNLLNNAIKFTPQGGKIEVKTSISDNNIIIEIIDNGIGMEEVDVVHIFERFKQIDSSDTRQYQGTGLGLSLVKELTELQNGSVKVSSKIGKGTNFSLFFPIWNEADLDEDLSEESIKEKVIEDDKISNLHKTARKSSGVILEDEDDILENIHDIDSAIKKDATILVVDDEPVMLKFVSSILQKDGYDVLQAHDGQEGIDMAKEHKPEIILFDLMLPKVNGLVACAELKRDVNLALTKIILLTAKTDEKSKITALENGADDFITKPFSSIEIKSRIANLLQNRKLQENLQISNEDLATTLSTLQSTQSQLLHSEKINAIGNLSAGLLHEVNNPLNYTMTALQMMKMDPIFTTDEDLKETLADIEEGMGRIKSIVTDLHAFAHPDEASKKGNFLIHDAVNSVLKFTAHDCKDIKIENSIDKNLIVIGSSSHIVQILINLITNACKAIKHSQNSENGEINIFAKQTEDRALICVQDNGSGMNEETLNKIFNPFFTTNDVGEGIGLGLSICHTIVKNHDGSLKVESEIGKGSVFSFDLPI